MAREEEHRFAIDGYRLIIVGAMRYELTGIDDRAEGNTELLIRVEVYRRLAVIPWNRTEKARLFLNPTNVAELHIPVATFVEVVPTATMPVFTNPELQTVVETVKTHTTRIQAENRRTFTYVSAAMSVTSVVDLTLKAVVLPGEKTDHGQLIEAVAIPWFDIIDVLKRDPKLAFEIPPRKWEEIVAGAYKKAGFDEVTLTPASGDFGRDVIAVKRGIGAIRVIDQVKAYKPGHLVTANDVRALFGVVNADNASKGFLTTTSDFAPKLKDDVLLKPFIPSRVELINGAMLLKRLEELAQKRK